jgi:hypothetical protein
MRKTTAILCGVLLGASVAIGAGARAGPPCAIIEGSAIGAVRIGMPVAAALAATGPAAGQQASGTAVVFLLRGAWSRMTAEYGQVTRVMTSAPQCRTPRGLGPGTAAGALRTAYPGASVSAVTPLPDGELLSYPFVGIAFVVRGGRIESVEVFRAEGAAPGARSLPPAPIPPGTGGPASAAPAAGPGSPAVWAIRSTAAQVQDTLLVITGTIENHGVAASAYAEIQAFNAIGRVVARGDAPLVPTPVPARGVATFELRLPIDDVVRRYTVTLRPARLLTVTLAEAAGELRNLQQFAALVSRKLRIGVEAATTPPGSDDFAVVVTNAGPLAVAAATIRVDLTVTCRLAQINFPIGRQITEQRAGSAVVQRIAPGGSARAALSLSAGVCPQFLTWSAVTRADDVRIGE